MTRRFYAIVGILLLAGLGLWAAMRSDTLMGQLVAADTFTATGPNGEKPNANGIIRLKKGDDITIQWNFPGKKCIAGEGNNDWYYGEGLDPTTSGNITQGESGTVTLHNRQRIESFTLECHLQFSAIWQIPLISKTIILVFDSLDFAPPAPNTFEIIGSNGSRMNGAGELTVPIGTDVIVQWNYPNRVCVPQQPPSPNELYSMAEWKPEWEMVGNINQESVGVRVLRARTQNESYRIKCDKDSTFMTLNLPTPVDETRKLLIGNLMTVGGANSSPSGPSVDVKINGQDGIVVVPRGATVTVSWTTSGVARCNTTTSFAPWGPYVSKPLNGSEQMVVSQGLTVGLQCARTLTSAMEFLDSNSGIRLTQCTDGVDNDNDGKIDYGVPAQVKTWGPVTPSLVVGGASGLGPAITLVTGLQGGQTLKLDTIAGSYSNGVPCSTYMAVNSQTYFRGEFRNSAGAYVQPVEGGLYFPLWTGNTTTVPAGATQLIAYGITKSTYAGNCSLSGIVEQTNTFDAECIDASDDNESNAASPVSSSNTSAGAASSQQLVGGLPAGSIQGPSVCDTICGDGVVTGDELCDDGNRINTDACNNNCGRASSSSSSSASSLAACIPGTICPSGDICPQNGFCLQASSASSTGIVCIPGTICPTGDICPLNGFCPPFSSSSSSRSSVGACVPGTQCPDGAICPQNGQCPVSSSSSSSVGRCIPGTLCPTGDACPVNGVCPVQCVPGTICPTGDTCPQNGVCPQESSSLSSAGVESCTINADCPSNLCLGGYCSCTGSEQCEGNACVGGFCTNIHAAADLVAFATCTSDKECPVNMLCQDGYCAPDLALCGNGIVDAGEVCDDGNDVDIDGCTATCLLSDGAACSNPRQCRSLICKDGVCTPCVSDNECPDDMACVEGACSTVNPIDSIDPDKDGMVVLSDGYKIAASLFSQLGSDARPENLSYEDYLLLMQQHAAGHAPVGSTGPESVAIMAAGASAGYAWMKMRKMKKGK